MSDRRFRVYVVTEVTVTLDDQVVSDWDGSTLLTMHQNGERWIANEPISLDDAVAFVAVQNGIYGSRDGLADFPDRSYSTSVSAGEIISVEEA